MHAHLYNNHTHSNYNRSQKQGFYNLFYLHVHRSTLSLNKSSPGLDRHHYLFPCNSRGFRWYGFVEFDWRFDCFQGLFAMSSLLFPTCSHPIKRSLPWWVSSGFEMTNLCLKKARSLRALISPTLLITLTVVWINSLSYRTGTFLRFSKSIVESYWEGRWIVRTLRKGECPQ